MGATFLSTVTVPEEEEAVAVARGGGATTVVGAAGGVTTSGCGGAPSFVLDVPFVVVVLVAVIVATVLVLAALTDCSCKKLWALGLALLLRGDVRRGEIGCEAKLGTAVEAGADAVVTAGVEAAKEAVSVCPVLTCSGFFTSPAALDCG
jgi:hypothetical protein